MTKREELMAKKDELAALKERIEANDNEAIEKGLELKAGIEALETEVEQADKKSALLNVIGNEKGKDMEEKTGIAALDLTSLKEGRGSVSTFIKAYNDNETAPTVPVYDNKVVDAVPQLRVRDLFGAEQISGNSLTYYTMGEVEGTITTVDEGGAKPQIHIPYTPVTAALVKVAAYFKDTDELLNDAPFLESAIRNRGIFEFKKAVESYLLDTLTGTSGIQKSTSAVSFDTILAAKQDIMAETGYAADAMIINPADLATLLQAKDETNQYILGGPAFGSYGNGAYNSNPKIWGLEVVESSAMPAGQVVVGAFKAGASVVGKAGEGLRVEVSNSDQDDFIKNRVTVRIEERLLEAVRVPAAFCLIGASASSAS